MINDTNIAKGLNPTIIDEKDSTNVNIQNSYLLDVNGNSCIKKLLACVLLGIGILMGIILFWRGLKSPADMFEASYSTMQFFLLSGSGLLGLSTVENLRGIFGKR